MILMQAYCSGQLGYASGAIRRIARLTARIGDTTSFEASAAKSILWVQNINDVFVTGGAKAGIDLGENGSVIPRPKAKR